MEFTATGRYLRISPRKARLVVDLVRGMSVESALAQLQNIPKKGARLVEKILKSAIANAEQQDVGDVEQLVVGEAYVNEGPTLRRFRARAMGRATRIRKRTSHVTIKLRD